MITPQEIQKKVFARVTFGGYDMSAVDEFLDTVYADYSSVYKDNALLKSKMKVLIDKIEEYRKVDDAMRQTLISAQNMANEIIGNAKKQSEEMTSVARAEAEKQIADYRAEAERYRLKLEQTRREAEQLIDNGLRACSGSMSMLETLKREISSIGTSDAETNNGAEQTSTANQSDEQYKSEQQNETNSYSQQSGSRSENNGQSDEESEFELNLDDTTSFEVKVGCTASVAQ